MSPPLLDQPATHTKLYKNNAENITTKIYKNNPGNITHLTMQII